MKIGIINLELASELALHLGILNCNWKTGVPCYTLSSIVVLIISLLLLMNSL